MGLNQKVFEDWFAEYIELETWERGATLSTTSVPHVNIEEEYI